MYFSFSISGDFKVATRTKMHQKARTDHAVADCIPRNKHAVTTQSGLF
jgi:hypothetical protein